VSDLEHPAPVEALHAARTIVLAAMSASTGTQAYRSVLEAAGGIPAGLLLPTLAICGQLLGRRGEQIIEAALFLEIYGKQPP
jgi:hypothetical protein